MIQKPVFHVTALGLLAAFAMAAPSEKSNPCKKSASYVLTSCKKSASADYWLARGNCANLKDVDEREACVDDAIEALDEALAECKEQYDARVDLCKSFGGAAYDPEIDPTAFTGVSTNPYMPLVPGTTFVYEQQTTEGLETIHYTVTSETKTILGVECFVVHDIVDVDGEVTEDTFDWLAEDVDGNVWYFGELSFEYADGELVGTEGSWTGGVDSAKPGIVMFAAPIVGEVYRQEFFLGEAEDVAAALDLGASVTVPYGSFGACLQTEEYTPIEPGHLEHKYYAPGVGLVLEENPETGARTELVSITTS